MLYTGGYTCNFVNCYSKVKLESKSGGYCLGGILSASVGNTNFTNCYNTGEISGSGNAGGILGYMQNTGVVTIDKCYNIGKVTNDLGGCCGGLVGVVSNTSNVLKITESYNGGDILGKNIVAGILARNVGNSTVNDSYNFGNISGNMIGGVIGFTSVASNININGCYNRGNLIGIDSYIIGGILGFVNEGNKFSTKKINYWSSNCGAEYGIGNSKINDGTESKSNNEMQMQNFVNLLNSNLDIEIWKKDINSGYPILKWQFEE